MCRVLIDADKPAPGGIAFRVQPPMPRLEVSVSGLPPTLLAGEVVQCSMRLKNSGAMTLHRMSMAAAASSGILLLRRSDDGSGTSSLDVGAGAQQPVGSTGACPAGDLVASFRQGTAVFSLPTAWLGVGQELTLPVWFRCEGNACGCGVVRRRQQASGRCCRCDWCVLTHCHLLTVLLCRAPQVGPAHFALAWRYEPLVRLDALSYRTVRFAQSVEALPSLHLAARLAAGMGGCAPGGCLLQAHVHNAATDALAVTGLNCPNSTWQLCQPSGSGNGGPVLGPDMAATLHRQLVPAGQEVAGTEAAGASGSATMSAAAAGLLDISRRAAAAAAAAAAKHLPVVQQQQQERQRRQRRQQRHAEDEGSMDVVVLWQAGGKDGLAACRGFTCVHRLR